MYKQIIRLLLIVCWFPINGIAQSTPKDSILFDVLLNDNIPKDFGNISFIHSIDVTPDGFVLLSSSEQFYLLGIGGIIPLSERTKKNINSFTQTPGGALMMICEEGFGYLDSLGIFKKLFGLPDKGMRIQSGKEVLYLYGYNSQHDKYVIYVLFKGAEYLTLLEYQSPITSVLEMGEYLFFSSENKLMMIDIEDKEVTEILELPDKNEEIVSMTKDVVNNVIYLSSNKFVYRIINESIECINDQFGGILHHDGEGLLIFIPDKSYIVRFRDTALYLK